MPMTVSNLNIPNDQLPTKRYQADSPTKWIKHISTLMQQSRKISLDQVDANGTCFVLSSNVFVFGAWLRFNCSSIVGHPFIVCEKKLNIEHTQQLYKRPLAHCKPNFLEFYWYCIRLAKHFNNSQVTLFKEDDKPEVNDAVLMRILTAWTMPLYSGQKRHAINIVKWRQKDKCKCYTSFDSMSIEYKTWYNNTNCSCNNKYPTFIMIPQTKAVISNYLLLCANDNYQQGIYVCDNGADCQGKEGKQNCFHICSTPGQCISGCLFPGCICIPFYHQCTLGGCVHQAFVCDGIVHCPADDSDELMCRYHQPSRSTKTKRLLNNAFSLCNSFSNETYPNNEICLLTRDQFGTTAHCSNTEHLRYCTDFRCPNHYKCLESYCIPMHLVCDEVPDCPTGQDEDHCNEFKCQGFFQCKGMSMCLHFNYLCDGVVDCPIHQDDEEFCDSLQCPKECECAGLTVTCLTITQPIIQSIFKFKKSKAITLTSNNPITTLTDINFRSFQWLLILNLTRFVYDIYPRAFTYMPQLRILDLTNVRVNLHKENGFKHMDSLRHLYLIRTEIFTLYRNTFQLSNLLYLFLQRSGIQHIENGAFCMSSKIRTLNLYYNKITHITAESFQCLKSLQFLDIDSNKLTIVAESALNGIPGVSFSEHILLCCFLSPISSCQIDNIAISSVVRQNECHPILSDYIWLKVIYAFTGFASILLSIIFISKTLSTKESKTNKTTRFIQLIAISDAFNGIYISTVFVSDVINELLAEKIVRRKQLLDVLYYLSVLPRLSIMTTRFEHLLMTVGMYMATCHVLLDVRSHIRVARLIAWVFCVSYCVLDIVFLRHVVNRYSLLWHLYQRTDYSIKDIFSVVVFADYELIVFAVIIFLCIYKSVELIEKRVTGKRNHKKRAVAKKLIRLGIGRALITVLSILLMVILSFHTGLTSVAKELFIVLVVPSSTVINFIMLYSYK